MSASAPPRPRPRVVNLLDDFGLGGVTRGLSVFDSDPVRAVADSSVQAVGAQAAIAPRVDAEVIVLHFPPSWRRLLFLASLRLRNPRARIIHVEHSYSPEWEALKVRHHWRFHAMLKMAFGMVDQLVCVSRGQASWLAGAAGIDASKIEVIYPYAENPGLDALPVPDFAARKVLRIGAYGRFSEPKGFDTLIRAFRDGHLPGCELIMGGFGPDEEYLRALAGDTPGISFVGKVTCVADFLRDCDIIAVPSAWEAYGQVANEAREAARPILVAPVGGLPEQVGDAGLVVDFTDPQAITAALRQLTSDRLHAMAVAGREATRDCGPHRQRQWARLIARMAA